MKNRKKGKLYKKILILAFIIYFVYTLIMQQYKIKNIKK